MIKKVIESLVNGNYITSGEPYTTALPKLAVADGILSEVEIGVQETAAYTVACDRMATAYQTYGYYEKVEEYFDKSLVIRENVLGTDHPDTAIAYNDLAALCYSQRRYNEAEEYYLKAIAIFEKALGEEHPDTIDTYNKLAEFYETQRRDREAEEYYLKTFAI